MNEERRYMVADSPGARELAIEMLYKTKIWRVPMTEGEIDERLRGYEDDGTLTWSYGRDGGCYLWYCDENHNEIANLATGHIIARPDQAAERLFL